MAQRNQKPNWFDRLLNICLALVNAMLCLLMIIVIADVLMTQVFQTPLKWAHEVSEYVLAFIVFLGAGWLMREEGHLRFDMVLNRLSSKWRAALEFFVSVVMLLVSIVVIWAGIAICVSLYQRGALTESVLQWPRWILISSVPLGFLILALQLIRRSVRFWKDWISWSGRNLSSVDQAKDNGA